VVASKYVPYLTVYPRLKLYDVIIFKGYFSYVLTPLKHLLLRPLSAIIIACNTLQ